MEQQQQTKVKRIKVKMPTIQRNKSAYHFFYKSFKESNNNNAIGLSELSRLCSAAWKALQDKTEWIDKAKLDKERYETELAAEWLVNLSDLKQHKRKMERAAFYLYMQEKLPEALENNHGKRKLECIIDVERGWKDQKKSKRNAYKNEVMKNI